VQVGREALTSTFTPPDPLDSPNYVERRTLRQSGRLHGGWSVADGMNAVIDGTRLVSSRITVDRLKIHA
jgi:hypothetical protein